MEVDKSSSDNAAAQRLASKRQQQELEEQKLQLELGRSQREHQRAVEAVREKTDKEMVEISKQATNQVEATRKLNSDLVRGLEANAHKNYEVLSEKTAADIKRLEANAFKTVEDAKLGTMDRIRNVTERTEDPFYRLKGLDPVLSESDKDYTIQVKLPPHEAQNLFVSGEGAAVKLALSRRFQDNVKAPEGGRTTSTSSYQSVVEQVAMPGAFDGKKIERSYKDGVVTLRIPKLQFGVTEKSGKA